MNTTGLAVSETVYAQELLAAFERHSKNIKVLSLDCFDTLLWRMTATPEDVFFAAQHSPAFQSIGLTATLRSQSESKARQLRCFKDNTAEIKLNDIYRTYFPSISDTQLNALTEAEIAAELVVCYAFPPIMELIRVAQQRGIKIIIVSDTYLTENQLRLLLSHALPQDMMSAIDKVFCSCEYNRSKINGLFDTVLHSIKVKPEHFLHIGDNMAADYIAARTLKLNALHFVQDHPYVNNLQRLHRLAANLMNPTTRTTQPLYNPFHALFSMSDINTNRPDALIGYYSLGPVLYIFAHFILKEVEAMRLMGKKPKVLFLMRDGHLPALACEIMAGQSIGTSVRLPRFVAYAASFRTEEDIDNYLSGLINSKRFHDIARQLLLPPKVSEPLIRSAEKSLTPEIEFVKLIHRPDILRIIFKKSAEYRERLKLYLRKETQLESGDTVVFVDLGYMGTTQRQLGFIFNELGVDVEGRYLIALGVSMHETCRVGLLDRTNFDDKTLFSIVHFIAMFEQLCTANERSVINYDDEGNIIYSNVTMDDQQQLKLLAIQSECLRFIQNAKDFFVALPNKLTPDMEREIVLAELARMIFLPTGQELSYLQSFQFDLNLGVEDIYPLFDPKTALAGLKRRGLFYIDKDTTSRRTNYPAELRIAGYELALTFMSHIRFNLDSSLEDMLPRQEFIEAHFLQHQNGYASMLGATATHDGFFSVWTDVNTEMRFIVGKRYQWIQIDSAEFIKKEFFHNQKEVGNIINAQNSLIFDGIINHGGGLFQCLADSSSIIIKPHSQLENMNYVFRLVYRPIVFQMQTTQRYM